MTTHSRPEPFRVIDANKLLDVARDYYDEARAKEHAVQQIAADLNDAGIPVRIIATRLGISTSTAHDWIQRGRSRNDEVVTTSGDAVDE
jgi:transposase-like protein